jgi:hypothetical protein
MLEKKVCNSNYYDFFYSKKAQILTVSKYTFIYKKDVCRLFTKYGDQDEKLLKDENFVYSHTMGITCGDP